MITYYKKILFTFFYLGFILSAYSLDAQFSIDIVKGIIPFEITQDGRFLLRLAETDFEFNAPAVFKAPMKKLYRENFLSISSEFDGIGYGTEAEEKTYYTRECFIGENNELLIDFFPAFFGLKRNDEKPNKQFPFAGVWTDGINEFKIPTAKKGVIHISVQISAECLPFEIDYTVTKNEKEKRISFETQTLKTGKITEEFFKDNLDTALNNFKYLNLIYVEEFPLRLSAADTNTETDNALIFIRLPFYAEKPQKKSVSGLWYLTEIFSFDYFMFIELPNETGGKAKGVICIRGAVG